MPLKVHKAEIEAIAPLLAQEWEDAADLAAALVRALDEARAERTTWFAVLQFGTRVPIYLGLGPYDGRKTAERALRGHPAAGEAVLGVVVPILSPRGLEAMLTALDSPPKRQESPVIWKRKKAS